MTPDERRSRQRAFLAARARLADDYRASRQDDRHAWRSLDELADTPEFRAFLHREFPRGASELLDGLSRRQFLRLMGASLALAGLTACASQPHDKIVPYVNQPAQVTPGKPLFFATATPFGGYGTGVLAESHLGRPTKLEGNPDHPASLGATDAITQATLLDLYDPDRSQTVLRDGRISSWDVFLGALQPVLAKFRANGGAGLYVLTETVTSPTLADQLAALRRAYPAARWHQYEPAGRDNARLGARLAFGTDVNPVYRFADADVIVALDADFLMHWPGSVRYEREFIDGRRVRADRQTMNRLYAVETAPTLVGALADHRQALRPSEVAAFAAGLARALGVDAGAGPAAAPAVPWLAAAVRDLQQHRGRGLVLAGEAQPPLVHALAHAINDALGNAGHTVVYTEPVEAAPADQLAALRALVGDLVAGKVDTLAILGGNPVYDAPADLAFGARLTSAPLRIHLGPFADETAALCQWHIPQAHYLETWSDIRAFDGTATIMQPTIEPLYGGKSAHEVLAALVDGVDRTGHDIVRAYWQGRHAGGDFETFWQTTLHDGVVRDTAAAPRAVAIQPGFAGRAAPAAPADQGLELAFRPDPTIWDGRYADNGWLQELPKPLTKLTWDNAALVSPATARRLGLVTDNTDPESKSAGDAVGVPLVELRYRGGVVEAPLWVMPGHADDCATIHLGYGRTRTGKVGTGLGFNAYLLRTSDAPWGGPGLEVRPPGKRYTLATTQNHGTMEGRDILRSGTLADYRRDPRFDHADERVPARGPSLYPDYQYPDYAWAMSIDLNACVGCGACVLACQAENNIPVVGKLQVSEGREMHWIRVDRYYTGPAEAPETAFQPVPCMQCENAPCELVCPVGATVHDSEGLNDMVYQRCIGTRYCSNNCPYKVRRFNFFQYTDQREPTLMLMRNPEVTVRERGVMEKCTYCVQRIVQTRIAAQNEGRMIRDGEVQTACQQVCPTRAIVFGNINDRGSAVAKLKAEPADYSLLGELNTRPRTTYLPRLRNPNPDVTTS
ncbi:MAG TPA: TAT-variant-translocated molybdopterin oxidoreductase [Thermomicrobiales bacterium]|nr:TAT-variant-translocated molybdopterin oxidoreductase [Thermomicrobiales bacterium]